MEYILDTMNNEDKEKYKNLNALEQYFLYKSDKQFKDHLPLLKEGEGKKRFEEFITRMQIKDPDSGGSKMLQIFVKRIFNSSYLVTNKNGVVFTDTMNSVQHTLNLVTKEFIAENKEKVNLFYEKTPLNGSTRNSIFFAANDKETNYYRWIHNNYPELIEFIKTYHQIGNFIPVPEGFNAGRGFADYWDMALNAIFLYYKENNEKYLKDMFGKNIAARKNTKTWLDSYGS